MVAGKSRFLDAFDGGQWQYGDDSFPEAMVTFFGGTFVKHPLSLAAAKAVLLQIKEGGWQLQEELNLRAKIFAEKLRALFIKTQAPLAVKSAASIIAIKVIDSFPLSKLFFHMMRYKGVYMTERAGFISTEHTEADLEKVLHIYEEAIAEMFERQFFTPWNGEDLNEIIDPDELGLAANPNLPKSIPLTHGQEEIWIGHQFSDQAACAYNLATEIRLEGPFDAEKMKTAINQLVKRHEALRTTFTRDGSKQVITPIETIEIAVPIIDLSKTDPEAELTLEQIHEKEAETPMDLFEGPLSRFQIIRIAKDIHLVMITVHHIIADGWSLGIISTDLGELYARETGKKHRNLNPPKQLSNFVLEEAKAKVSPSYLQSEEYWYQEFSEEIPILEFPTDYLRPAVKTYNAALERIHLSPETHQKIKKTAARQGTTFYNFMFTAFQVFIHRLSHQKKFTLGVVAAGQAIAGNQDLVGHSVSLLPLKMEIEESDSFVRHLKKVRGKILDAFDHQNYTLGALVKRLKIARDTSRQPIISVLFNLDNEFNQLNFGDLKVSTRAVPRNYETFDIFINLKTGKNGITFEWIYNTDLFKRNTIKRRLAEFTTLLEGVLNHPETAIYQLPILPSTEKEKLLTEWNNTNVDNFKKENIFNLFEQQVGKTPQKIALSFGNQKFTYSQLIDKTNKFSAYLRSKGLKKGMKVGIFLDRSAEMLISLLAVLKSGAIYVPLDPVNPGERLQNILEDVEASMLISHYALKNILPPFEGINLFYEECPNEAVSEADEPDISVKPEDLAYIIYTSGSTGKPKGIAIPHYAVIDHHNAIINKFGITRSDKILGVASIAFDPSVQDFFMPLFVGGEVIIADKEAVRDGFKLLQLIEEHQPTLMQATPSTWQMLLLAGWNGNANLKVLAGGEGLSKELAGKLLAGNKEVWNIYGPTETTIWSTTGQVKAEMLEDSSFSYLPVGQPIDNVKIYILDNHLQMAPIGVSGEIYIAGVGLAPNGYHKLPELNQKVFVANPYSRDKKYDRLYRTGDRGRYLPNGSIEYLNRGDKQVKIRGYRIELGDIETTISQFEKVQENRVMIRKDHKGDRALVAYLIPINRKSFNLNELKAYLKEQLPAYMIPAAFVLLDQFPLTPSKKVDRNQLPPPVWQSKKSKVKELVALTKTEKILRVIWEELLEIKNLEIDDDFFDLGGHSLIAVNMMAKIHQVLNRKVPLSALLKHSTIRQLAKLLDQNKESTYNHSLVPIKTTGQKPPLYLVHGGGLHVLMFQTLAEHMDEDQPIYALQAKGLNGDSEPLTRIEDMAAHYISEIRRQNPEGPYALAGYSFGGLIAFEMARQLKAEGREVFMLAVFDTVIKPELSHLSPTLTEKIASVGKKVAWNLKDLVANPSENINYRKFIYQRRFNYWKSKFFEEGSHPVKDGNTQLTTLINKSNFEAWKNYKITPYEGDLYLFRAKEQRFYIEDKTFLGWQPFVKGNITTLDVPGDHLNLFNPPNGEKFAGIIQQLLDSFEFQTNEFK